MKKFNLFNSWQSTVIVAEISANHNQNYELAEKTILAAKESGADAIKLQTYTADTLTIQCDNEYFQIPGDSPWAGKTLYELYEEAYMPWDWQPKLKTFAQKLGLLFFSTPFDKTSVDFLKNMGVPIYKIASFEIFDTPFLRYVASQKKPMIISTGMASLSDIELAIQVCKEEGNSNIILMKCTSAYPAPLEEANLATIPELRERFNLPVGLSDHTIGDIAALTSVALGAKIVEKHFTLDRNLGGPDAHFSMEPAEFKSMVKKIRAVEKSLGKPFFVPTDSARKNLVFARSLFVVSDVKKGDLISDQNVRSIRPGHGIPPKYLPEILGKKFNSDVKRGTPLSWDMLGE